MSDSNEHVNWSMRTGSVVSLTHDHRTMAEREGTLGASLPQFSVHIPHSYLATSRRQEVKGFSLWSQDVFLLKQALEQSLAIRYNLFPAYCPCCVFGWLVLFSFWSLDVDHSQFKLRFISSYPVARYSMLLSTVTYFCMVTFELQYI